MATWSIPQLPEIEKKEKTRLDTKKLDEAFSLSRYLEKHGLDKVDEWKELRKKKKEKDKEKSIIQPENVVKKSGFNIPKLEDVDDTILGQEYPDNNTVGLAESVGHAIVSGNIKIPMGFANLAAEITDLFAAEGIPVDKSKVAKLNSWFEDTILGQAMKYSEKKARATATGRISEAMIQLVGAYKTAGKGGIWLFNKGAEISDNMIDAYKAKKYIKAGNPNLYKGAKKSAQLKKMSYGREFGAVALSGVTTAAGVYDIEDIGTFGDIFFEEGNLSALDREERRDAQEDAERRLFNRLRFGAELGFPIMPFIYGGGKIAKMISSKGKELAYSNSMFERWVDRWIAQPFRSRSKYPRELAKEMRGVEGKESSARVIAEDFLRNLDDKYKKISRTIKPGVEAVENPEVVSKALAELLTSTKDAVKNNKIIFNGFNDKALQAFYKSMKNIGIDQKGAEQLAGELMNVRMSMTGFKNSILQGRNIVNEKGNWSEAVKSFNDLMNDRFVHSLAPDFRIFTDKAILPWNAFKPTREVQEQAARIFQRNWIENNPGAKKMPMEEAMAIVRSIMKNAELDPITQSPVFPYRSMSMLDDASVQIKNISKNIEGGKFKADKDGGLIKTESDLKTFQKLFGSYKNANQVITNTMSDFAAIGAKNAMYNNIKKQSAEMVKRGERGLVYSTYAEAQKAFPHQKIIKNETGLKLSSGLPDDMYVSPLDGMFTTKEIADGLKLLDDQALSSLTKNLAYRWLVMIPKGFAQMGKTVFGPFTHSRNFFSGAFTTTATGNAIIPPKELIKNLNLALKTIQPQTMYRVTGDPKWRNIRGVNTTDPTKLVNLEEGGQGLYQFLLDESVVNSSATYRDVLGLLKDIQKGGDFLTRVFDKFGKRSKGLIKWSQDMYIAEDDIWKVFNFLGESYKMNRAFQNAVAKGQIKSSQIPSQLEIYKESARVIRNTVPNYAYVSDFVQGMRRSPLGNFVSFPAEIIRTSTNIMEEGMKNVRGQNEFLLKHKLDPKLFARNGYEKLAGFAFTTAALPVMVYQGAKWLYGISEDKIQAIREMVAPWSVDSTLLPYVNEDGSYGYVDFSHGSFYDTITNPVQAVLNGVNANDDKPLVTGLANGVVRAIGRLIDPFISESIWLGVVQDLFARNGVTRDGRRIFNERDTLGNKIWASMKHAAYTMSPGSLPQLRRLYAAMAGETIKGQQYEIPKELLGFFGFRGVDLDPPRTLNFRIQEYNRDKRAERKLIYEGTLTGDPVKDNDKIVEQFIKANMQHLETMSKIKRTIDAAKVLGMRDREIKQMFKDRGQEKLYTKYLRRNKFQPFGLSAGYVQAYKDLAKEKGIANPLNKSVERRIKKIIKRLKKQKLNSNFIIKTSDYVSALPGQAQPSTMTAGVATPPVDASQFAQANTQNVLPTGLTRTETALLSPQEQAMRLRQRGIA